MQRLDVALKEQVRKWLYDWVVQVKAEAERQAPVRTGYLQSTVYAVVNEWAVEVGAKAVYSFFVEFVNRYMSAHPFLYPAVQWFLPELETYIIGAIERAKAEAGL
jgi:hypothetical protein